MLAGELSFSTVVAVSGSGADVFCLEVRFIVDQSIYNQLVRFSILDERLVWKMFNCNNNKTSFNNDTCKAS